MLIDQTSAIPYFQSQQPQSFLKKRGLMGLGQDESDSALVATSGMSWQEIQAGFNSQLLFLLNLDRLQSGQAAIAPEHAAPQVQAKLDPQTKNILTLAALGIGGILLFAVTKK